MKTRSIAIMGLAVLVLLLCVFFFFKFAIAWNEKPGKGEKIGHIVKVDPSIGRVPGCFTAEGQLIRGGLEDGSGAFGVQPFEFTIESEELLKQARKAMVDRTEVIITYRIEWFYWKCRSSSKGIFLVSIKSVDKKSR